MNKTEVLVHAANARIALLVAQHYGMISYDARKPDNTHLRGQYSAVYTEMQKEADYLESLVSNVELTDKSQVRTVTEAPYSSCGGINCQRVTLQDDPDDSDINQVHEGSVCCTECGVTGCNGECW